MNENAFEAAADNEKAFRRKLRAIEADAENESGLSPLPREFWREVALHIEKQEEIGIGEDGKVEYCDGDRMANKDALSLYSRYVDRHIGTAKIAVQTFGRATGNDTKGKPKNIYRKAFERRFHLLAFVLDRKGFEHRARKGFWTDMTAEWNRQHPYDQRTPEDLRARYADYIKDDSLWNAYVATRIMGSASLSGTGKLTCSATVTKAIRETPLRVKEVKHDRKHNEKR